MDVLGIGEKSKYKMLEMFVFNETNREFGICRDEYFFKINDSTVMEKIKVIVIDFAQNEESCFGQSNNRKMIRTKEDLKQKLCEQFKTTGIGFRRVRLNWITQDGREPELHAKLMSRYLGTFENGMGKIKLVKDRKFALKLTLNREPIGRVRGKPNPPKSITIGISQRETEEKGEKLRRGISLYPRKEIT